MHRKLLILLLALGLTACGSEDSAQSGSSSVAQEAPREDASPDMASLVPSDAQAVIYFKSLDAALSVLNRFAEAIDEPVPMSPLEAISSMTGIAPEMLDTTRSAAVAFKLPKNAMMPIMTFVLPVKDVAAAEKAAQTAMLMPNNASSGGWLGLSFADGYAKGDGSKLMTGMPVGDFVMRVDLQSLVAQYQADIDGGLMIGQGFAQQALGAQMPGMDAVGMLDSIFGFAKDFIESAETLEVVFGMTGNELGASLSYVAKAGSKMAEGGGGGSDLRGLAQHVPAGWPVTIMFKFDMNTMMEFSRTMAMSAFQALPEADRARMEKHLDRGMALSKDLGDDWVIALNVKADGLRMAMSGRAKDPAAYLDSWTELMMTDDAKVGGVSVKELGTRKVGGATVRRHQIVIDAERLAALSSGQFRPQAITMFLALMFGQGGIQLDVASKGDAFLMVMGDPEVTDGLLAATAAPADLQASLAKVPGDLGFLVHVDLRGLLQGVAGLMAKVGERVPEIPEGGPLPITLYGARSGRAYRLGVSFDVVELKELIDALK